MKSSYSPFNISAIPPGNSEGAVRMYSHLEYFHHGINYADPLEQDGTGLIT